MLMKLVISVSYIILFWMGSSHANDLKVIENSRQIMLMNHQKQVQKKGKILLRSMSRSYKEMNRKRFLKTKSENSFEKEEKAFERHYLIDKANKWSMEDDV